MFDLRLCGHRILAAAIYPARDPSGYEATYLCVWIGRHSFNCLWNDNRPCDRVCGGARW